MNRKKPVLKNIFPEELDTEPEFWKVLELGLLLALKERGVLSQFQHELLEETLR